MQTQEQRISLGSLTFYPKRKVIIVRGEEGKLRHKESEVLLLLCTAHPEVVTREMFERQVWPEGYVTPQTITQTIKSLRIALDDRNREVVITIPKQGYLLNMPPVFGEGATEEGVRLSDEEPSPVHVQDKEPGNSASFSLKHGLAYALTVVLIGFAAVYAGKLYQSLYISSINAKNLPINANLDPEAKDDAEFLARYAQAPGFLLKRVANHYVVCKHYKEGTKCEVAQ